MRRLVFILLLFLVNYGFSQTESNNFTTYDTTLSIPEPGNPFGPHDVWLVRVHRPTNYFTAGNADTASRPAFFTILGEGENGNSDTVNLAAYGSFYWLQHGWDGSVQLGNGTHYPLQFTIQYVNSDQTYVQSVQLLVDTLFKYYHPKARGHHFTGLSEGAFTWGSLVAYEDTVGDQSGMKLMTSVAPLTGTPNPSVIDPDSTLKADTPQYKIWAAKYHGKYFYLEGSGSDNFRNGWQYANAMNDSVPGSAYFSYENAGSPPGSHSGWNTMWDPSEQNWTCVNPPGLGPYNSPSQSGTNTMGTYFAPSSIYQWMLRQGDTSLVGSGFTPPTVNAGSNQTITLPTSTVTLAGSATPISPATSITSYAWSQLSGPNTGTFSSTTVTNPTFSGLIAGTYVLQLTAVDNESSSNSATVTITVNAENTPPTVSAGSNQTITLPTSSVTLAGSATAISPATSISSYAWTQTSGPNTGTFSSTTITGPTFSGLIQGSYILRLMATDNNGNTNSANVTITVNAANACNVYTWSSSNGNIVIDRTNYPTLKGCDTVYIPVKSGGYRSQTYNNLYCGTVAPTQNQLIHVVWKNGAYITPSTSSLFANTIDSLYGVEIRGCNQNDMIDPFFSNYGMTGYLKYVLFNRDTIRGTNGFFPSSALTFTLPTFTGDSTNCFYKVEWRGCEWDSVIGANSGETALYLGAITSAENQYWIYPTIDSCSFANYSSAANPSCYIYMETCFGAVIRNDSFATLAMNVAHPVGHQESIFTQAAQFYIFHNKFGPNNFGNDIRNIGAGVLKTMSTVPTGLGNTNGRSAVYENITSRKRKYPFLETRTDPSDTPTIGTFYKPRTGPEVWNISAFRMAAGAGNSYYSASVVDCYELDSVFLKNSYDCGPLMDTAWNYCGGLGCNAIITAPNGTVAVYDTASLRFDSAFAISGLADTVSFYPALNGKLYNQGITVPSYVNRDLYNTSVPATGRPSFGLNTGVDIGAVQYLSISPLPSSGIRIPRGNRIFVVP